MAGHIRKRIFITCVAAALLPALAGCTARVVKPGEKVTASFTCRLPNAEIAASTRKTAVEDPSIRKSVLFVMPRSDAPVRLVAGMPLERPAQGGALSFEEEILDRLSRTIVGRTFDSSETVLLSDDDIPADMAEGHLLKMARVRKRPKELRIPLAAYRSRMDAEPVVGAGYSPDPAIPGTIKEVTADEVLVVFSRKPGDVVDTPLRKGVIRDGGAMYEIVIDAHPGDVVRSGPLAGRITQVDDREIIIDYGRPLAGEKLTCEVELAADKQ